MKRIYTITFYLLGWEKKVSLVFSTMDEAIAFAEDYVNKRDGDCFAYDIE